VATHTHIAIVLKSYASNPNGSMGVELPFAASPELKTWLALQPLPVTLPWYGEGMYLASSATITQAQIGYGILADGRPSNGWPKDWIVIGTVSSDPVIANSAVEGTPVYYSVHGTGKLQAEPLAPTLRSFAESLAVWLSAIGDSGMVVDDGVLLAPVERAVKVEVAVLVGNDWLPLWLGRHWLD
jgi:hypothetical protein